MPRAIWSGVISFGLVSVPVRMYTATESKGKPLPERSADEGGEVVDLMEALRQSVAATKRSSSRGSTGAKATPRKKTAPGQKTGSRKKTASRKAS